MLCHKDPTTALTLVLAGFLSGCGGGSSGPASPSTSAPPPGIGAAGGAVAGTSARLAVPAGALAAPVALAIRSATSGPLDPYAVPGSGVEVTPPGTAFAAPALLTVSYASGQPPLGTAPDELRLHRLEGGVWRLLPGGSSNPGALEVTAPIDGAGIFGVRWSPGPAVACSGAEARQFDFWLGSWNLVVPGGVAGTNDITRNGCVLEEEFHEVSGTIGRSVSFFSGGRWYQTYIDSRGGRVPLTGILEGGSMVLYISGAPGRSTWQPLSRDRVRFFQEQQSATGWGITFDSTYVRR